MKIYAETEYQGIERKQLANYVSRLSQNNFEFSESDIEDLKSIANSCPWEYGNGVFIARSMLEMTGNYSYDDTELCGDREDGERSDVSSVLGKLNIYPNPNTGTFMLQLPENRNEELRAVLFSITGVEQQSLLIPVGVQRQLIHLPVGEKGIFFLKVVGGNTETVHKVIIQ